MTDTDAPDLPAVRKSAVKLFARDIDAALAPHDYFRTGASLWVKKGLLDGEDSPLRAEVIGLIRDLGVPHLKKFHSVLDRFVKRQSPRS